MHTPPPMVAPEPGALRLGVVTDDARRPLVRDALALTFPTASIASEWTTRVPDVRALVVDAGADAASGMDVVRDLRARGYMGGVVMIHDGAADATVRERASRLGVGALVALENIARELGPAVAGTLPDPALDPAAQRAWASVRRAQQLVAAGEVAARLQHALANPLTALLAEAQLLEMEPLAPSVREAVGRIVAQCRRTIQVAKRLDGVG